MEFLSPATKTDLEEDSEEEVKVEPLEGAWRLDSFDDETLEPVKAVSAFTRPWMSHRQVHSFLSSRECSGRRPPPNGFPKVASRRIPHLLREKELMGLDKCDKIFASAWLDCDRVIAGTKDNQLIVWSVKTGRHFCLPSYLGEGFRVDHCGIHSIAIGPSGVIATGGQAPEDILLLDQTTLRPSSLLKGHGDWVFALAWLSDRLLVSGSRDRSVMLWDVKGGGAKHGVQRPKAVRVYHKDKIRDLAFDHVTRQFATISTDGVLMVWDEGTLEPAGSMTLEERQDLVCMTCATQRHLFACGSEAHVQLVDPRVPLTLRTIPAVSASSPSGVRSLNFIEDMLTVGGGDGTLSFYDLRAGRYLELESNNGLKYVQTGRGYLKEDDVYRMHFSHQQTNNTVYTHCFDPTNTKLFVGGGPLPFGLCGSYAAVW